MKRRLGDLTARDVDEMRARHDRAELDRHDREQEGREPVDDAVEPAEVLRAERALRARNAEARA